MAPTFDGPDITKEENTRLSSQLSLVKSIMKDGAWYTLADLCEKVNATTASVSARIRDLRKPKFGGHQVERKRVSRGLYKYRLVTDGTPS